MSEPFKFESNRQYCFTSLYTTFSLSWARLVLTTTSNYFNPLHMCHGCCGYDDYGSDSDLTDLDTDTDESLEDSSRCSDYSSLQSEAPYEDGAGDYSGETCGNHCLYLFARNGSPTTFQMSSLRQSAPGQTKEPLPKRQQQKNVLTKENNLLVSSLPCQSISFSR
jgi:hypothetical protein